MQKYYDLEINILSCLLQRPELMKDVILEDKHFIKHNRLWQFMKAFYSKFETFDIMLMYNICKNKYEIIKYIEWLVEVEPAPSKFNLYQTQLIELYHEKEIEKTIINKVYELSNELYVRKINLQQFKTEIDKLFKNID